MISSLAFLLLWNPVTADCHGGPEPVPPVYEVRIWRADVSGHYTGPDGGQWPVYTTIDEKQLTPGTSWPLPEPTVGGVVAWWDPVAVDLARNRSDGPCN